MPPAYDRAPRRRRRSSLSDLIPNRKARPGTQRWIPPETRLIPTRRRRLKKGLRSGPPTQTPGPYDPRGKRWPI